MHPGDPLGCDELSDAPWDKLHGDCKGTLLTSLKEFKEQAVAGQVSLGSDVEVSGCAVTSSGCGVDANATRLGSAQ